MATITLKVKDKVLQQVLGLLNQFEKEEVEILSTNNSEKQISQELHNELFRFETNQAKTYSIDEVDHFLEKTILEYEG